MSLTCAGRSGVGSLGCGDGIRCNVAYSTGTSTIVRMVPNVSPAITVTAIPPDQSDVGRNGRTLSCR